MTLDTFFQLSVSIFCVIATILMIATLIWFIWFQIKIAKLAKKLEDILENVKLTTAEVRSFVERTITWLETFKKSIFTFEFIRNIVMNIINLIKNNSKGKKDGEESREVE